MYLCFLKYELMLYQDYYSVNFMIHCLKIRSYPLHLHFFIEKGQDQTPPKVMMEAVTAW